MRTAKDVRHFVIWILLLSILSIWAESEVGNGEMFFRDCPTRMNCSVPCISVELAVQSSVYSAENVVCLDNTISDASRRYGSYNISGCPGGFSSTTQSTRGVCINGVTELYLSVPDMKAGLHSFNCFGSQSFLSGEAIVVNNSVPYRDVLIFVNGNFDSHRQKKNPNITVKEGDNITIIARAVQIGGISQRSPVVTNPLMANASHRFACFTDFFCNDETSNIDVAGHYWNCSLMTPAKLSDNGTLVAFSVSSVPAEIGSVRIAVNETPTVMTPTPSVPSVPFPSKGSSDQTTIIIVSVVIPLILIILVVVLVILFVIGCRRYRRSHISRDENGRASSSRRQESKSSNDYQPLPKGNGQNMKVFVCTCGRVNGDQILNKLKESKDYDVELVEIWPPSLDQQISFLDAKLSKGEVLIDCTCREEDHLHVHKALKYFTEISHGSADSKRWRILRLNHTGGEVTCSKLNDQVEVMQYNDLNSVLDEVVSKLKQYSHSRTSSISSGVCNAGLQEGQIKTIIKQNQEILDRQKLTQEVVVNKHDSLLEGQRSVKEQIATTQVKQNEKLDLINESLQDVVTGQHATNKNLLRLEEKS